jgi:predicted CoA-binding protein
VREEEESIMSTEYEKFWDHSSYAVVGHTARKGFPKLTYGALKEQGKKVYAVDPSVDEVEGDRSFPDLASLPEKVDAAVLEVPRQETEEWVRKAADAGIAKLWIHMNRDTPEALAAAKERGLDVLTGTCAVMYAKRGLSYHSIHKWLNQLLGKY